MKKYLLVGMTIFTFTIAYSQTEKGKKLVGGQFNINGENNSNLDDSFSSDRNSFGFQIIPSFGYFIKDNFAIGANLNMGISNTTEVRGFPGIIPSDKFTTKSNSISYGGGGFVRYYKKILDSLFFTLNGAGTYTYQTTNLDYTNNDPNNLVLSTGDPALQEVQTKSITFAISPGFVYFMTRKLGITCSFSSIYYSNSSSKNISVLHDNHNDVNNYGFNLSVTTFYLGINYNF